LTCLGRAAGLRDVLRVVAGDVPRTTALLALKFDFIFFTGRERERESRGLAVTSRGC
jgi:hypothetical protein